MIYAALQSDTLSWQRSLKFAGFYRGRLDGITGPLTREAAAQWRESHQQLQTRYGRLDQRTEDKPAYPPAPGRAQGAPDDDGPARPGRLEAHLRHPHV